jgi:uncharacterized membrane protein HdeD (DUF308 family)/pimeloyl-ACP methyl ester carboxylesterase
MRQVITGRVWVRRLPWWLALILGAVCTGIGVALVAAPFRSLTVLVWLTGAALIGSGLAELVLTPDTRRPRVSAAVGVTWTIAGILALAWPGITALALALCTGLALVAGGAGKIVAAVSGDTDERWVLGLSGATGVVVGVLALSWPAATVLVLAVVFGVRTVLSGLSQMLLAWRSRSGDGAVPDARRRWPTPLQVTGTALALVLALGGMGLSVALHHAQPAAPGAFYTPASPLPSDPAGTILRSEVIPGYYAGATTYRVLYLSTGYDGKPAAVSGLIVVPDGPPPSGGRKVLAYTHGTVGVASNCAPSAQPESRNPLTVEGAGLFLAAGYVIAATDYQGLGTPGPHPYLVGRSEAMNALDSVRAAGNLPQAHAGRDFAIWGHSQGGQAALFTAQFAASYAPELHLAGVAAGGPVPDLIELFKVNVSTLIGRALLAMGLQSWSQVYHDANLDQIVVRSARPLVAKIARTCLYSQGQLVGALPSSLLLGFTFISNPPWTTEPWKTIAEQNAPGGEAINAPILLVQGDADTIIPPGVTEKLGARMCGRGETVDLRLYPGIGHLATSEHAASDVAHWIADRFAGKTAPSTCPAQ